MLMFPHSITIYRYNADETYTMQTVTGVYWQEQTGVNTANKGTQESNKVTVITSPETTANYGTWTVQAKDRIIKGTGEAITSFKDLSNSYTVMDVAFNTAGTAVDNIVIAGV